MARPICWLGIDPSYANFAIVRLHGDGSHHADEIKFTPKLTGTGSQRLDAIWRVLQDKFAALYNAFTIKAVCLEGYAMQSMFGREMAGELGGIVRVLSMRELLRMPLIVAPAALKKFVTGAGKADKDAMCAAVKELWGVDVPSHDVADAYGLARIAEASTKGATEPHQREVLKTVMQRNAK